jgi:hypothetical protein
MTSLYGDARTSASYSNCSELKRICTGEVLQHHKTPIPFPCNLNEPMQRTCEHHNSPFIPNDKCKEHVSAAMHHPSRNEPMQRICEYYNAPSLLNDNCGEDASNTMHHPCRMNKCREDASTAMHHQFRMNECRKHASTTLQLLGSALTGRSLGARARCLMNRSE